MASESPVRRSTALRVAEPLAWTLGLVLIGIYAAIRIHGSTAARTEVRRFEQLKTAPKTLSWAAPDPSLWSPERMDAFLKSVESTPPPLAVLRIPKLGLEVPVLEGTDDATLDRGVGHIEGTARPGAPGNLGIAGHRDGFFRGLKDIVPGDSIELETLKGCEVYAVESVRLVSPDDVWVLDPTPSPELTLVTCYPFYYVGSAPQRYVVKAAPVGPVPRI